MLKRYHKIAGGIFRLVDACVIGVTWLCAYFLRFYFPLIDTPKSLPPFSTYATLTPLVIFLWVIVFSSMRVYQSHRMLRRTHEVYLLIKAHMIALLLFIVLTYLISEYKYSRLIMFYFGTFSLFFLIIFRLALRNFLRTMRKKGYNLRYAIGVGEGPILETVIAKIEKFPELGIRLVGVLTHELSDIKNIKGKPVLGHFTEIQRIISEKNIDEVLIALPRKQTQELDQILRLLHNETVSIKLLPDLHEYITLGCEVEDFEGFPLVNLNDSPLEGWGGIIKRITDLVLSCLLIILFTPLMLAIALIIKLTSRGDIFYTRKRMGLDGKLFKMIKFRTMVTNFDEEKGTAAWSTKKNDKRLTAFGSFFRTTSLDELPQLFNVFKGEMSLVGPRPERPVFVEKFRKDIPHYMLRHKVKAGMTGWAQINGWRGDTSLSNRIEFDLYYIKNWSYFFDFKILFVTLWKGFINRNAY
ncbi:MAG: undecaprenyl-phosphate glucose phosphotransferase [Deltaproteobacteria bacterium]|nr:undecaprenyl-phosphate glucose phosphotransferase [Deltaproteobacteria bacterium]